MNILSVFFILLAISASQEFQSDTEEQQTSTNEGLTDENQRASSDSDALCPRDRDEAIARGRQCLRKCTMDADCISSRKRCLCDGQCGWSCVRPDLNCDELPLIQEGSYEVMGNYFGARVIYSCNGGFFMSGPKERVCQGDGSWSDTAPTCKETAMCGSPPNVPNAGHNLNSDQTEFAIDSMAEYDCFVGFEASGFSKAKCLYYNGTAQWFGPDLKCLPKSCGNPGGVDDGKREGKIFTFAAKISYSCNDGFELVGRATRFCQSNGQWSGSTPTCSPVKCDVPEQIENGKVFYSLLSFNSTIRYECNYGFKLNGPEIRRCDQNRTWSLAGSDSSTGGKLNPLCKQIDCGSPGSLPNGFMEGRKTTLGSVITYRCFDETVFLGTSNTTTCTDLGIWSHGLPSCLAPCVVPLIENGRITSANVGSKVSHGAMIEVICKPQYESIVSNTTTCNNGSWSVIPICVPERCKQLPERPKNGLVIAPKSDHGMKAAFKCRDGFTLVGPNVTKCHFGKWIEPTPTCQETSCKFLPNSPWMNVSIIKGNESFKHGTVVDISCSSGFKLNFGSSSWYSLNSISLANNHNQASSYNIYGNPLEPMNTTARCVRGFWKPKEPECVIASCNVPLVSNGVYYYHYLRLKLGTEINHSETIHVQCDPGFTSIGSPSVKCWFGNWTWTSEEPECAPSSCILPELHHGLYPEGHRSGLTINHGSFIQYTCNDGYLKGTEIIPRCIEGKLKPEPPHCLSALLLYANSVDGQRGNSSEEADRENEEAFGEEDEERMIEAMTSSDRSLFEALLKLSSKFEMENERHEMSEAAISAANWCPNPFEHESIIDLIAESNDQELDAKVLALSSKVLYKFAESMDGKLESRLEGHSHDYYNSMAGHEDMVQIESNVGSFLPPRSDCYVLEEGPLVAGSTTQERSRRSASETKNHVIDERKFHLFREERRTGLRISGSNNADEDHVTQVMKKATTGHQSVKLYRNDKGGHHNDSRHETSNNDTAQGIRRKGFNDETKEDQYTIVPRDHETKLSSLPSIHTRYHAEEREETSNYLLHKAGNERPKSKTKDVHLNPFSESNNVENQLKSLSQKINERTDQNLPSSTSSSSSSNISSRPTLSSSHRYLSVSSSPPPTVKTGEPSLKITRRVETSGKEEKVSRKGEENGEASWLWRENEKVFKSKVKERNSQLIPRVPIKTSHGNGDLWHLREKREEIQDDFVGSGKKNESMRAFRLMLLKEIKERKSHPPGTSIIFKCINHPPLQLDENGQMVNETRTGKADLNATSVQEGNNNDPEFWFKGSEGATEEVRSWRISCSANRGWLSTSLPCIRKGKRMSDSRGQIADLKNNEPGIDVQDEYSDFGDYDEEEKAARKRFRLKQLANKTCSFKPPKTDSNVLAFDGDMLLNSSAEFNPGSTITYRCTDIGKFELVGTRKRTCSYGQWDGKEVKCFGLSQEHDYALEKAPTVLFRHQNGPIAQSTDGQLIVYPGIILHLECLYIRKFGTPSWVVDHYPSSKRGQKVSENNYTQGWTSEVGRDSTLEYRLSIYDTKANDSGVYSCVTPVKHRTSIEIIVKAVHCPPLDLSDGLIMSNSSTQMGTNVILSCKAGLKLAGSGVSRITCLPSGHWSSQLPTCESDCPEPISPEDVVLGNDEQSAVSEREASSALERGAHLNQVELAGHESTSSAKE